MKFQNVIIGELLVSPDQLFAGDESDWTNNEIQKTLFTTDRFLPKIMVDCGIVKSISEVKRNQPKFCVTLDKVDFIRVKWGKDNIYVAIGK
jgi:hypothetical protein